MFYIGCHLSPSDGFLAMGQTAKSINATTFQFFTRNPRGGAAKPLDKEDAAALCAFMKEHEFGKILAHAPYTLNACAADDLVDALADHEVTLTSATCIRMAGHERKEISTGLDSNRVDIVRLNDGDFTDLIGE